MYYIAEKKYESSLLSVILDFIKWEWQTFHQKKYKVLPNYCDHFANLEGTRGACFASTTSLPANEARLSSAQVEPPNNETHSFSVFYQPLPLSLDNLADESTVLTFRTSPENSRPGPSFCAPQSRSTSDHNGIGSS